MDESSRMLRRVLICAPLSFICTYACDAEKEVSNSSLSAGAECLVGTDTEVAAAADVYLLPTLAEAKQLENAEKNRHQGTINLLLAKHGALATPAGSTCQVLELEEEFAKVRAAATNKSGWLPLSQLRAAKD